MAVNKSKKWVDKGIKVVPKAKRMLFSFKLNPIKSKAEKQRILQAIRDLFQRKVK